MNVGDTVAYVFIDEGVQVFANNRMIGSFANPDHGSVLLGGLIADHPPTQEFGAKLLCLQ
jgi:hypothetical protein